MSVDLERRHDLPINIDIRFPAVPCAVLSLDVLDVSGTMENDASFAKGMNLHKHRLDVNGNKVGKSEYITPQSEHLINNGMGMAMMNVNIPQAIKVGRSMALITMDSALACVTLIDFLFTSTQSPIPLSSTHAHKYAARD